MADSPPLPCTRRFHSPLVIGLTSNSNTCISFCKFSNFIIYFCRSWSNYTNCLDSAEGKVFTLINQFTLFGLSASLASLLFSILLFSTFQSLKCPRISLHRQLCLAMALNNTAWILWYIYLFIFHFNAITRYYLILSESEVWTSNSMWCRVSLSVYVHLM